MTSNPDSNRSLGRSTASAGSAKGETDPVNKARQEFAIFERPSASTARALIEEITRLRAREAELVEALRLTSGALQAGQNSMASRVAFTGDWSHLGTHSVSEILDNANDVLPRALTAQQEGTRDEKL